MSIKENIEKLKKEVPSDIGILVATKTRSAQQIKEAVNAGIKIFGENYVQEAEKKYADIKKNNKVELYFIGHLQKNKINRALKIFDVISIDSFELTDAINKRAEKKVKVIIEINIANEPQKAGCKPEELFDLIKKISKLKNIEVIGLMTMAPFFDDVEKTRHYFRKMKVLFDKNGNLKVLSLGMTHDYKIAIEEGSNLIRIGSLIFS